MEASTPVEAKKSSSTVPMPTVALTTLNAAQSPSQTFQGYESVNGISLSTATEGKVVTEGASSTVNYSVNLDSASLSQSLEIDQSLSVGFGPFGGGDEKMKFFKSLNVTTYSVTILVFARHSIGSTNVVDVNLKAGITPPTTQQQMIDFFRGYGDSYTSSITQGGEYYATYTFYSQTQQEQDSLVVDMKAKGIFDVVTVDASLQAKLNSFISTTNVRVSFNQSVSGIRNPNLPNADHIIEYALSFPGIPLDAPAIIGFQSTGYEHVPGFGSFQPIAANRSYFIGKGTDDGGLTSKLVEIVELQDQINWIKSIYNFYGGYTDAQLNTVSDQAAANRSAINQQMQAYQDNPTQSLTMPPLPCLQYGSPSLTYNIGNSPQWGGGGGGNFDDVNVLSWLHNKTTVSAVQLRTGSRVDKLIVTYRSTQGTWIDEHGGNGGGASNVLTLLPGQFIQRLNGRSGARVDQLNITLTDGRSVGGGGGGGSAYDWSVPNGSFVLGFSGRSGAELDAVRAVYATFTPASWNQ